MQTTLTKEGTARALLDHALVLLLDEQLFEGALVLAGSSESVSHDLLNKRGETSSRDELVEAMRRIVEKINRCPTPKAMTLHGVIRSPFDWMRHAKDADDPPSITFCLREEATHCALRALDNLWKLEPTPHPRERELIEFERLL